MKKVVKRTLIGIFALLVIAILLPEEEQAVQEETSHEEVQEVEEVTSSITDSTYEEEEEKEVSFETMASFVESCTENFDYHKVTFDEETKTIHVMATNDGMAEALVSVKAGVTDDSEWEAVKDTMDKTSIQIKNALEKAFGVEGVNVSLSVLNDKNIELTFYTTVNGFGVYDVLAE